MEFFFFTWNGCKIKMSIDTQNHEDFGSHSTDVEIFGKQLFLLAPVSTNGTLLSDKSSCTLEVSYLTTETKDQIRNEAYEYWLKSQI